MRVKRTRTASELLTIWGLLYSQGQLRDIIKRVGTGEDQGIDEEQLAADYVCKTPGYFRALPVLRHVHVDFHRPHSFDPCLPGESLPDALRRLEWRFLTGIERKHVGPMVYEEFVKGLIDRTRNEPFVYWEEQAEHVLPLRRQFA